MTGPDFPSGGFIVGRQRHLPGLHDRARLDHDAREVVGRGEQEGRQAVDRHHRDSVPDQQGAADREDRRARAREDDRRDQRPARRVGSRRHAHRHRAEARRDARRHPEQSLQAHPAADDVRDHHAGDRRRAAEGPQPARGHRAVHRVPPRGRPAPDRVRAAQGRGPGPYPGRPQDRARPPRRGDQADSRIEEPGRGARRADDAVQAVAAPVAGDPRHAAAAADRPRAPEDPRRAPRADEDHRAPSRHSLERGAPDAGWWSAS